MSREPLQFRLEPNQEVLRVVIDTDSFGDSMTAYGSNGMIWKGTHMPHIEIEDHHREAYPNAAFEDLRKLVGTH